MPLQLGYNSLAMPRGCCNFEAKFHLMYTILILGLGTQEIVLILIIVLLLFGGRKIPELMRGLGRGVREFNDAKNNVQSEIRKGMEEDPKKPES